MTQEYLTQDELKELSLYGVAIGAISFTTSIINNSDEHLNTTEIIAFLATYAMIFGDNYGLGKLPDSVLKDLRKEERSLHNRLLKMRNSDYAHWDAKPIVEKFIKAQIKHEFEQYNSKLKEEEIHKYHLDINWRPTDSDPTTCVGFHRSDATLNKNNTDLINLLSNLVNSIKGLQTPLLKKLAPKNFYEKNYYSVYCDEKGEFQLIPKEKPNT